MESIAVAGFESCDRFLGELHLGVAEDALRAQRAEPVASLLSLDRDELTRT